MVKKTFDAKNAFILKTYVFDIWGNSNKYQQLICHEATLEFTQALCLYRLKSVPTMGQAASQNYGTKHYIRVLRKFVPQYNYFLFS